MIEIVSDVTGLAALEPIWIRLEAGCHMRIFQTYFWCRMAWECVLSKDPANKLYIFFWKRGEDAMIMPTYIDRKGRLRFIADDDSDVCDAVYEVGFNHNVAYREIAKAIQGEPMIKGVWLQKLYGESEAANYLGVLLSGAIIAKDNAFSWLEVQSGKDFIAAQSHMPSKDRADLKGVLRHSKKYTLKVVSVNRGDVFPRIEISTLRDEMRKNGKRDVEYFGDDNLTFVEEVYKHGGCDIALLWDGEKLVAANILLKKDNRVLSWIFLYIDNKASTALYVKYLCDQHHVSDYVFDFGVGVYSYKIGTFRPKMGITYSLRYGKSHLGQLRALAKTNIRMLKDYVKAILKK